MEETLVVDSVELSKIEMKYLGNNAGLRSMKDIKSLTKIEFEENNESALAMKDIKGLKASIFGFVSKC